MKNKWIAFGLLAFMVYAYINQTDKSPDKSTLTNPEQSLKEVDIFSKDGVAVESITLGISEEKITDNQPQKQSGGVIISTDKDPGYIQKKILSIATAVLNTEHGQKIIDKLLTSVKDSSRFELPVNQDPYFNNTAKIIQEGIGQKAECGEEVTLDYKFYDLNGTVLVNTTENGKPIKMTIGFDKSKFPELNYSVIGMSKHSIKSLLVPPQRTPKNVNPEQSFGKLEIHLIDLKPRTIVDNNNFQIFDKLLGNREEVYKCGGIVNINYIIKDIDGNILFGSNRPISIGSRHTPYALQKVVENMGKNAKRVAIVPHSYFKNIYGEETNFFPKTLKKLNTYVFEVSTGTNTN
jgi:hypothetical protein